MQKADARANSALPAEPWHTRSMARVVPRFSLLFFLVALVSQGCDCDCGSTTNGDGDGDVDGMVGDGNVGDGQAGDGNVDALVDGNQADVAPYVPPDVHVLLTADNAYGFGYGSATAIQNVSGLSARSSTRFDGNTWTRPERMAAAPRLACSGPTLFHAPRSGLS